MILKVYNRTQDHMVGTNILYTQQKLQYLLHYNLYKRKDNQEAYTDHKKRFIMDLSILLQATVRKGTDVILTVDFNAVIGEDHDALILLIHKAGLRNTIATCHGFETEIATYKHNACGLRRID